MFRDDEHLEYTFIDKADYFSKRIEMTIRNN